MCLIPALTVLYVPSCSAPPVTTAASSPGLALSHSRTLTLSLSLLSVSTMQLGVHSHTHTLSPSLPLSPGDDAAVVTGGAEQLGTYKTVRAGIRHI